MLGKIRRRFALWRHRNDRVVWQAHADGRVPGSDCPWVAGDIFDLHSPSGKVLGPTEIDAEFASDLNRAFRWIKDFFA